MAEGLEALEAVVGAHAAGADAAEGQLLLQELGHLGGLGLQRSGQASEGRQQIGAFLGAWYGEVLARDESLPRPDWVLPVPLHPRKQRKRGYNQCRAFGRAVAARLGAPYSEKWLQRTAESRTQTGKDRWDRWLEIRHAFRVRNSPELEGSRILLLDDVITTGATLEAGCQALYSITGIEVYVAAIAVVP